MAAGVLEDGPIDRKEAARLLGIAPSTLARWAGERRGPAFVVICGRAYYGRSEVVRWAEGAMRHGELPTPSDGAGTQLALAIPPAK